MEKLFKKPLSSPGCLKAVQKVEGDLLKLILSKECVVDFCKD